MRAGKELDTAVREMMVQCLQDRPEEPMSWMLGYMLNQNAGLATPETPCAVASTSEPADGPAMHLAVSHPDAATQKVCISAWDRTYVNVGSNISACHRLPSVWLPPSYMLDAFTYVEAG